MTRRKKHALHQNHDRWLVSYADFITLLFALFVVLYASSQVDKRKVGRLALAIQVAFQDMGVFEDSTEEPIDSSQPMPSSRLQAVENIQPNASVGRVASYPEGQLGGGAENGELAQLRTELASTLAAEIQRKEVSMRHEPDGLVISLREVGLFASGSAQIIPSSQPALDRIANLLRGRNCRLRIEGHTDDTPIHNSQFSSNWELSTARSTEVVRLLIVREGYDPKRLAAAGYAEFHPVASNSTAEGRSINRRLDIVVLNQEVAPVPGTPAATGPSPSPETKPTALVPSGQRAPG